MEDNNLLRASEILLIANIKKHEQILGDNLAHSIIAHIYGITSFQELEIAQNTINVLNPITNKEVVNVLQYFNIQHKFFKAFGVSNKKYYKYATSSNNHLLTLGVPTQKLNHKIFPINKFFENNLGELEEVFNYEIRENSIAKRRYHRKNQPK